MSMCIWNKSLQRRIPSSDAVPALSTASSTQRTTKELMVNQPITKLQSYPYYAFSFGDTEIVVISDGPLDMGKPEDSIRGLSKEEIDEQLLRNFLPTGKIVIEQNIPMLISGGRRILFETGVGSLKMFGANAGRLQSGLQMAGIDSGSIDTIICSHPHPDHIGGICTEDGMPLFPNAQIYLSENDFYFWTDEKLLGTRLDRLVKIARDNLLPVRDRIVFFKDGQEFVPGVRATFTPGHTKEHASFIVTSGNQSMYLLGDVSHHPVLLLERPLSHFIYDLDPRQAAETRLKVLDMLAEERMALFGGHFPWPGIGHVAKEKDGFRYFPKAARWTDPDA